MNKVKIAVCFVGLILLLGIAGGCFFSSETYIQIKTDLEKLKTEEYDTVFFSMYPIDYYSEEDYALFWEMDIVKTDYIIPNGKMLQLYMNEVNESENSVTTIYLGIRPEKLSVNSIANIVQKYPDITFEIILAHPHIDFWLDKSDKETEKILDRYKDIAETLFPLSNARVYYFGGQEWLVCNSSNYEDSFLTNPQVSRFLLANTDPYHPYMLNMSNIEEQFANITDLINQQKNNPIQYADGSDTDIIFLGDSIIGNYTNSLSIPQVVGALTDAGVYNCGIGGRSAALGREDELSVSMIAEGIVSGNISAFPTDMQVYLGSKEFLERPDTNRNLMFVIHYGFNDYFKGYPVKTENALDEYSYSGAMRKAVQELKRAYPDANILLVVPGFTTCYECGEQIWEQGGKMEEYREAVRALALELEVECLDLAKEMPTNIENWTFYLDDGVHFNERGRYLVGQLIALQIQ